MYACIKHLYAVYLISRITRGNKSFWWAGGYDPKSLLADPLKYPVSIWTMPEMAFIGAPPPPPFGARVSREAPRVLYNYIASALQVP